MGKLKLLNIAIAAMVICIFMALIVPMLSVMEDYGCVRNQLWILPICAATALIFTFLEEKQKEAVMYI